ncbi:MAG: magnesium transporter [Phycisphaerae bacterium]|nr:magnesium transporter [Phycisphaerae bacterium]
MTLDAKSELHEALEESVRQGDTAQVQSLIESMPLGEAGYVLDHVSSETRRRLLELLPPKTGADLLEHVPEAQAADLLAAPDPEVCAAILEKLSSNHRADLVRQFDDRRGEQVLGAMSPDTATETRLLCAYEPNVAGGLMIREYLSFPEGWTVAQVLDDFRRNADRYRDYDVQYAYVTDQGRRLVGVLRLRDLILANPGRAVRDVMIRDPLTIPDRADLIELTDFFDRHRFFGAPVVDPKNRLVGVIRRADVEAANAAHVESDYRKAQGILGGDELRSMPLLFRARRRLAWLSINIVLNIFAASIIALYQETLAAVIALAVFLPIISDMSGCSGNQAVGVTMRELALGVVRPTEFLRVLFKEMLVGLLNGSILGLLIAAVAWIWKGNPMLGLVVGAALAINTVVAVSIGGTVPLVLKRFGQDPALASGPILTTITDMCGFFLALSFAAATMPWLV